MMFPWRKRWYLHSIFIVLPTSPIQLRFMILRSMIVSFLLSVNPMAKYRYFKPEEFQACNPPCSIDQMDESFLMKLDDARSICSYPFFINSAYRSVEYEKQRGRSGSSSHCKGLAVDISCFSSVARLKMVMALIAVGFRRIGIYQTFIHVDNDKDKNKSMWYGSTK